MHPIFKSKLPKDKKSVFHDGWADIQLQKEEIYYVRMTAAGNFLEGRYTEKTSTEIADIETVKIPTNHIISSPGAKCCALDIHNMYLNTVLSTPEYMRIHILMIPNDIRIEYGINDDYVNNNEFVCFEITKAIYGLIQSGALAHADLK